MNNNNNKENVLQETNYTNTLTSETKHVLKETKVTTYPVTFGLSDSKNDKSKVQDQKTRKPLHEKSAKTSLEKEAVKTTHEENTITLEERSVTVFEEETVKVETIEKVRKTPSLEQQEKEEKPLFVQEEKEPIVNIHHKEQPEKELTTTPEEASKIKRLQAKLDTLKETGQEKQQILSELRQTLTINRKLIKEQKRINELKESIAALEAKDKEYDEYNKELADMIGQLNEKGLDHQKKYGEKEQEINRLVNILSETRYKIKEIP